MLTVALIAAFACPGPPAVLVDRPPGAVRTKVVACDGDRRVVLRRARLRRGRGSRVTDVSGPGRLVAWGELRYARGRVRAVVRATHLDSGPVQRRPVSRWRRVPPRLEVAVPARGGEIAYRVGRFVYHTWPDRLDRALDYDASGPLVLEDGRTVRWLSDDGTFRFEELGPEPRRCETRSRYRVIARSDRVVVTAADYPTAYPDEVVSVVRACLADDVQRPQDEVIAQARTDPRVGRFEVAGIRDEWVVLNRVTPGRGGGCEWVTVEVYGAEYGYPARQASHLGCERVPRPGTPLVVTTKGAPAWIVDSGGVSTLLTAAGRGAIVLDEAGGGGLTGLAADGKRVRWLHDGEPRSMDLG